MKSGQVSQPLKGDNGVAVVTVKSFQEPPATTDYSANIKTIADTRKSRSEYEVFNALKEKANVEDNRGKFY
jgi:peptidylprolyl isomerase/peptidyl-prolyl cis-trans isomerase D